MIQRATVFALLFLAFFTGASLFKMLSPSSQNQSNGLASLGIEKITRDSRVGTSNQQVRKGVSKDLWVSREEGEGLHHYIESPVSIIKTVYSENQIHLVEEMLEMRCYFQERIEEREGKLTQSIRYMHSEKGIYQYRGHLFHASNVFLALYRIPGKTLLTNLSAQESYLQGVAEGVTLSLLKGSPHFQAKTFKAQVLPETLL